MRKALFMVMTVAGLAASIALSPAAHAEESSGPVKWILKKAKLATDPSEPQDFVKATRPPADSLNYLSVGEKRPERARKPLDKAGVKGKEASFDGLKARNDGLIAGKPKIGPPPTLPPAAAKAKAEYDAAMKAKAATN